MEVARNPSPESINFSKFQLQSEDCDIAINETAVGAAVEESETVRFIDNAAGAVVEMPHTDNPVARVDDTEDITLGRFFARPTLINTTTWSTANVSGILGSFFPWYEFLNSPAIKRKLDNFAYLRGTLHVKVLVNGTPFQYGALRYAYRPFGGVGKVRSNAVSDLPLLIPYSQHPGAFVSPQANAGMEIALPFFYNKNWLDITSAADVQAMGNFWLVIYAPLRLAVAGGSTAVTLRTYAWMTDVQLMGSTSKLSLQSDEYGVGPVSRPASALAAVASALSNIPYIGKFARATEIGASAVSRMASLFGYTNVPVISDVHALVPMNAPAIASTQIGQPIQKLTLDPKQELSIDPSFHGLGSTDELALSYLKKKESYFGATSWATSDAAGTQLFNLRVNPNLDSAIDLDNAVPTTVGYRSYQVPLSYFGKLFRYWRGDIKIRMKVVCTKFHKGRLKISYDPVGDISIADPAENVVYTQIVDIGEQDDITFHIPYHQPEGWKEIDHSSGDNWTVGNALAPRAQFDNGTISIRVLNTLTAPAATTVNILFFVSGGDNFEYATPVTTMATSAGYPTLFDLQSEDVTDVVSTDVVIGTKAQELPERYGVNMGECVASLRTLLHRMSMYQIRTGPAVATTTQQYLRTSLKRLPAPPGFLAGTGFTVNRVLAAGTAEFVATYMTPLTWVTTAYCGYRGSTNWCITPAVPLSSIDHLMAYRTEDAGLTPFGFQGWVNVVGLSGSQTKKIVDAGPFSATPRIGAEAQGGGAMTVTRTNGSIMFNFPNYNKNNFAVADPRGLYLGTAADDTATDTVGVEMMIQNQGGWASSQYNGLSSTFLVGSGPDFAPVFFLCCPTVDYCPTITA